MCIRDSIGTGEDVTIKQLAETIQAAVGYTGKLDWDTSKPNGTPRKLLDVTKLHDLGFKHSISLQEGIEATLADFIAHADAYAKGRH